MTEIIIVKYGLPEYEAECVQQVTNCTKYPFHLTVYDNYPKDENLSIVWNRLIERSDAEYICLLNNDTIVSKGWLGKLLRAFSIKNAGAVGPISNRAGGAQGGFRAAVEDKIVQTLMLSGFCLLFPRSSWEIVGGFDEKFKIYGEDSDFCARLKKKRGLYIHYGVFVYHFGAQGTPIAEKRGKDMSAIRKESSLLFQRKIHET